MSEAFCRCLNREANQVAASSFEGLLHSKQFLDDFSAANSWRCNLVLLLFMESHMICRLPSIFPIMDNVPRKTLIQVQFSNWCRSSNLFSEDFFHCLDAIEEIVN